MIPLVAETDRNPAKTHQDIIGRRNGTPFSDRLSIFRRVRQYVCLGSRRNRSNDVRFGPTSFHFVRRFLAKTIRNRVCVGRCPDISRRDSK